MRLPRRRKTESHRRLTSLTSASDNLAKANINYDSPLVQCGDRAPRRSVSSLPLSGRGPFAPPAASTPWAATVAHTSPAAVSAARTALTPASGRGGQSGRWSGRPGRGGGRRGRGHQLAERVLELVSGVAAQLAVLDLGCGWDGGVGGLRLDYLGPVGDAALVGSAEKGAAMTQQKMKSTSRANNTGIILLSRRNVSTNPEPRAVNSLSKPKSEPCSLRYIRGLLWGRVLRRSGGGRGRPGGHVKGLDQGQEVDLRLYPHS
jgi:hypothetical protein